MRVSDFSMLWTHKLDSVGSSYNGQLSCLHWASLIALTLSTRQGRLRRIPSLGFLPIFTRCSHPTPPAVISTASASSPSSLPSTPTASSVPHPMDLDCTHLWKRYPLQVLCFNCLQPSHIKHTSPAPCPQ